jgi:hypothetical protein
MKAAICLFVCLLAGNVMAEEKPPLPFYDWDACPFECCAYQNWTLSQPVSFHLTHAKESPVMFRLEKGETVRGVTGVVITTKYGTTKVLKSIDEFAVAKDAGGPPLSGKPGDSLYVLNYEGEGASLFWYGGKLYSACFPSSKESAGQPPDSVRFQTESEPVTDWWVMIRSTDGKVGWSDETSAFEHMDSCE